MSVVIGTVATVIDHLLHTPGTDPTDSSWLSWLVFSGLLFHLYGLATLIPTLAICWRRMHDTNRSGLYVLVAPFTAVLAIPGLLLASVLGVGAGLIGPVIVAVLAALDGSRGDNRYGPDPKGPRHGYDAERDGPGLRAWAPSDARGPMPPKV